MSGKPALPTIGRVVYFYRGGDPKEYAAIVADVTGEYTVNLGVFDHSGREGGVFGVRHVDEKGGATYWWDWMPFQKGQAAKTEAVQAELDKAKAGG